MWVVVVAAAAVAASAADEVSAGFGNGGMVMTAIGKYSFASALVLQPDGKLVAAGASGRKGSLNGFALARYDKNGRLDRSFGNGGTVTTRFGRHAYAAALALQPDGKLVAAGTGFNGSRYGYGFALARYEKNGLLDRSFGERGTVTIPVGEGFHAWALLLQPDGKLVAAGTGYDGSNDEFELVRYDKHGRLDRSFGYGGTVATALAVSAYSSATALGLQPDGKLVAAGSAPSGGSANYGLNSGFALARYNKNGLLDPSFGHDGTVITAVGKTSNVTALVVRPDGKLIAAGSGPYTERGFKLARYDKNGRLDRSFGNHGTVTTANGSHASALVLQPDGKLVVAGIDGNDGFALARYDKNGRLDRSFGNGGRAATPTGRRSYATALVLQPDGKLVAAGQSKGGFLLARYQKNGRLDK